MNVGTEKSIPQCTPRKKVLEEVVISSKLSPFMNERKRKHARILGERLEKNNIEM